MNLPYELCSQIISQLPQRDLFSMCLVHPAHLKTAKQYLYRDVSAPLSPAGLQRFLEISRDPVLAPLVRTFKYPADTAVIITDIHGKPRSHLYSPKPRRRGRSKHLRIVLRQAASAEELQLITENNKKCWEQRAFFMSPKHGDMLKEAVRNLPNLEVLSLQLGIFKVDRRLEPLVQVSLAHIIRNGNIPWEGCDDLDFGLGLFDILHYTRTPTKTLELEGAGFSPQYGYSYQERMTFPQTEPYGITALRFRFNPTVESINSQRSCAAGVKFFSAIPSYMRCFMQLEKLTLIHTSPDPATEAIQPPTFKLPALVILGGQGPRAEIHTIDLEGVCIYNSSLPLICSRYRATLKNISIRRISLAGEWRSELSNMKKTGLQLETFEMSNVWEEPAAGVKRKLAAEAVGKFVEYMLSPEDSELMLECW
ncbi:hypothetical protein DFP73DRAFT_565442 [Morchella snyderi]|nr:hypothetical protein DFP73DRAFT_565442 [Morchella snyderi]